MAQNTRENIQAKLDELQHRIQKQLDVLKANIDKARAEARTGIDDASNRARSVQEQVTEEGVRILEELRRTPGTVSSQADDLLRSLRHRIVELQATGETRLFEAQVAALHSAAALAKKATDATGLEHIESMIAEIERRTIDPTIDAYDDLNVREVAAKLDGLSRNELLRIQFHERQNKNRKTVIQAVGKALDKLAEG